MNSLDYVVNKVLEVIRRDIRKNASDSYDTGTVKRIDGNIAWVQYDEKNPQVTPVVISGASCKKGDKVRIKNNNGTAFILGNDSNPPTDDTKAEHAQVTAEISGRTAEEAQTTASEAEQTATVANQTAEAAQGEIISTNERVQGLDDSIKDSLEGINTSLYGDDDESGMQGLLEGAIANIENLSSDYSQLWNNVYGFMKFGEDGQGRPILTLGSENSAFKTNITNEMIQFTYDGDVIAYLTGTALRVQDQLSFGNFVLYQRPNGHLTIKYIGGN